jgi:hypothetical protein
MFSSRLPAALAPNALTEAIARHRAAGRVAFDLTVTNPTEVGLAYPRDVLAPLVHPDGGQSLRSTHSAPAPPAVGTRTSLESA